MKQHEVYFILDPEYKGDLWELSRRYHVWICDSVANEPLIRGVWDNETEEYGPTCGVSSFEMHGERLDEFYAYLGTIDQHHDQYSADIPWTAIHVVGLAKDDVLLDRILQELDASVVVEPNRTGFTIRRL